ncbi:MAG: protein kinase [Sediminibacterium sp.]|nr:protein kinase [Sediminibacterium sp.]
MDFTFPKDKVLHQGTLKNYTARGPKEYFNLIDTLQPKSNLIQINNVEYFFTYLNSNGKSKGGNSVILKLYESQNIDLDEINYEIPDLVIKILKFRSADFETKSEKRFKKEINSLKKCKESNFSNVIHIFHDGVCKIFNSYYGNFDEHLFYTMEYAPYDLKTYIEAFHDQLSLDIKLNLCLSIAEGLKELESLNYFHRDIKPDNIFISGEVWKIGDLGLLSERFDANEIDDEAEPIGPRGWMSPESMNKYLTEGKGFSNSFTCKIDHQSDIFQLGKVFWYIFQHNAPIGSVKESDFKIRNSQIYSVIKTMLSHSKTKRYKKIDEVIKLLKAEETKLLKTLAF